VLTEVTVYINVLIVIETVHEVVIKDVVIN
jgi:hypothetical protein